MDLRCGFRDPVSQRTSTRPPGDIQMSTEVTDVVKLHRSATIPRRNSPILYTLTGSCRIAEKDTLPRRGLLAHRSHAPIITGGRQKESSILRSCAFKIISIQLGDDPNLVSEILTPKDIKSHSEHHARRASHPGRSLPKTRCKFKVKPDTTMVTTIHPPEPTRQT